MTTQNSFQQGQTKKCKMCQSEISKKATKCPQCHGDLRSWPSRHPIVTIFLLIILLSVIMSSMGGSNNTSDKNPAVNTPAQTINAESSSKVQETLKSKAWKKVIDFTASANKQSQSFHLDGGQQKIIYKTAGGSMSICAVYVMDEGTSLDNGGGFPVVSIDGIKSDETMMRKDAGDYYFDLKVANGNCTIELQELK